MAFSNDSDSSRNESMEVNLAGKDSLFEFVTEGIEKLLKINFVQLRLCYFEWGSTGLESERQIQSTKSAILGSSQFSLVLF